MYSEQKVAQDIRVAHDDKTAPKSLREIAASFGPPITHADIERILQGRFPTGVAKRAALHIPPVCVSCGQRVKRVRHVPDWVARGAEFLKSREETHHEDTKGTKEIRLYSRTGRRVI